jgi:hypothetical protein
MTMTTTTATVEGAMVATAAATTAVLLLMAVVLLWMAAASGTLGDHVGGGLIWMPAAVAKIESVFMTNKLREQLARRDGIGADGDSRNNGVERLIEARQDVGDELFIFNLLACCRHVVGQALHLAEVLGDGRRTPGRVCQRHPGGDDARPGLSCE